MQSFSGVFAGSSEISVYCYDADDQDILARYKAGTSLDECGIDFELVDILNALYCKGIRAIFNVTTCGLRLSTLIGAIWEGEFENAS